MNPRHPASRIVRPLQLGGAPHAAIRIHIRELICRHTHLCGEAVAGVSGNDRVAASTILGMRAFMTM